MSASTVHVKNISSQTSEQDVKEFFSFCGKIATIEITPSGETQNATVTFEKETAAKTALLLDNTQLGTSHVQVTSATGSNDDDGSHYTTNTQRDTDEITQEEKPRTRIIAEYLAHGYVIGDQATQRAIDLDKKHGVSSRFLTTLQNIDQKYHATDKAKSVDQSYGVSSKTNSLLSGLTSYYEKAAGTPTGQKLVNFYTQSVSQVQDIHNEARRLAELKKQEAAEKSGTEKTTSTSTPSAHDAATTGTGIVDSTKVAPLEPEKGAWSIVMIIKFIEMGYERIPGIAWTSIPLSFRLDISSLWNSSWNLILHFIIEICQSS